MRKFLAVCGLLLSSVVQAGYPCRTSYSYSYPVREKVIVKEVVNQKVVYALQNIPLFSLQYQPISYSSNYAVSVAEQKAVYYPQPYAVPVAPLYAPYVQQYQQPVVQKQLSCDEKLEALVQKLDVRFQQMEQRLGGVPERLPLQLNGGVFVKRCASCHDDSVAKVKGDGLVLFTGGQMDRWDSLTREEIRDALVEQRMPKGSKLSQAELNEAIAALKEMTRAEIKERSEPQQLKAEPNGNGKAPSKNYKNGEKVPPPEEKVEPPK